MRASRLRQSFTGIGNDGYGVARLDLERPHWAVGGTWLFTGYAEEEGWSVDAWAEVWGRDIMFEYANLEQFMNGVRLPGGINAPSAWMATPGLDHSARWQTTVTSCPRPASPAARLAV